ncbi:hypothetical protein Dole_1816 [Desulfosudis oleivorans Hxd3]|uniref:Uncharacterized protein n=2 Tax=Desulfosudis TaxID=2904716 RepID=A9A0Z5_DESOH|nr:hypothetical protein Dole_1816 [Desulfosudis oleivorans Hxd3]
MTDSAFFNIIPVIKNVLKTPGGSMHTNTIKVDLKPEILIQAVMNMKKKQREAFLEDLLASTSPDYLKSIKEARDDYKAGRIKTHDEVFEE